MNESPLVSVVIPVYKVEKYLEKSVHSIINQSYKNIEIILVNDGSPDRCPEICDDFALKYNNIIVIHKKNGGLSEARNFGISHANGEYILFLDSDDTLAKDAIEGLVMKAIESEADLVIPDRYMQISEATNTKEMRFHFNENGFIEDPVIFAIEVMIGKGRAWRAHALLYRASLIKDNNIEFPVGYIAEDIVFNLQVMSKARKIAFYEGATLNYLKRAGSITTSFQENLDQVFLFIDAQVKDFLIYTDTNNKYGNTKRNELLCRNAIIYISELFSKKCPWEKLERIKKANNFLDTEQVIAAFRIKKINPYFNNSLAFVYFDFMFKLIKINYKKSAYTLATVKGMLLKK